jgi:hypothetical protein
MSENGKRKDEDVRASDDRDESETHAPPKKVAKPADEIEDIFICNVSLSTIHLFFVCSSSYEF